MKKIFFITIIFLFLLTANSFALNFFADSAFSYSAGWSDGDGNSSKLTQTNIFGMMLGLGMNFQKAFTIKFDGVFFGGKFAEDDIPSGFDDVELEIVGFNFEIEFAPYIPALYNNRLQWFISLGVGFYDVSMTMESSTQPDHSEGEPGMPLTILTGFIINAAQNFAPFIKVGWQRNFYFDEWKEGENNAFNAVVGVRFYFLPTRKINNTY